MAGWVSNGTTNLNTASGGYRVEAANTGSSSSTTLSLATVRTQTLTFANAGNLKGIILTLQGSTTVDRDVEVRFQQTYTPITVTIASPGVVTFVGHGFAGGESFEFATTGALPTGITAGTTYYVSATGLTANTFQFSATNGGASINTTGSQSGVHSLWVDRAIVTKTLAQISNSVSNRVGAWTLDWNLGTPYAVDTTASKWRFRVIQTGGTTGNWLLVTSNGTAPFYVAYCDNAITFADNDYIVCKDPVTVTAAATVRGILGTGATNVAAAVIVCKSANAPTSANSEGNLIFSSSAAYTFTIDGWIVNTAHGAIRAGTDGSPITAANAITLHWSTPTNGTGYGITTPTGFNTQKCSWFLYGAYPTTEITYLDSDTTPSGSTITVDDATDYAVNDTLYFGRFASSASSSSQAYTITSVASSPTISITPSLSATVRLAGGKVIKTNGYGLNFTRVTGSGSSFGFGQCSNFIWRGFSWMFPTMGSAMAFGATSLTQAFDETANMSEWSITHAAMMATSNAIFSGMTPANGITFRYINALQCGNMISTFQQSDSNTNGTINIWDCYNGQGVSGAMTNATNGLVTYNFQRNTYEVFSFGQMNGKNLVFKDNYMWGGTSAGTQMSLIGLYNVADWSNNTWANTPTAITVTGPISGVIMNNENADTTYPPGTTWFMQPAAGAFINELEIRNPDFAPTISTTNQLSMVSNSRIAITNNDEVVNEDYNYLPEGDIARTGYGLADTTVNTSGSTWGAASAGKYAMRLQPKSSTVPLVWSQIVPTGDITGLDMTVVVRCKINSATYYAGTHANPKLTITYDGTSTVVAEASDSTSGQTLSATFRPSTSASQITVAISGMTDASGTAAYVYFDNFSVLFPAGSTLNLGGIDLWSEGLPITPTISTSISAADVWAVSKNVATSVSGSIGKDIGLSNTLIKDGLS